jgi:hypothetical protein
MQIFLDCYHNPNFKNGCCGNIHAGKYQPILPKLNSFSYNHTIEVFQSYLFYLAVIVTMTAKTQNWTFQFENH